MVNLGYNYRLTDFQCALAQSQLRKLPAWLDRRRHLAAFYQAEFGGMPELELPTMLADRESGWHLYTVRLNLDKLRVGRAEIFRALRAENIGVNVHYLPVPWHPYYQKLGYRRGEFPVAEREYERLLSLPLWPGMTDPDAEDVVRAVKKVLEAHRK
jgi:dTDP-4-amino-4,6-dideoxygalactose transaminase